MKKLLSVILSLTLLLGVAAIPVTADAAVSLAAQTQQKQLIKLKKNTTYKNYDVTGNGKANKFRYTVKKGTLKVKVDGKLTYTCSDTAKYTVNLCTLSNGKVYLNIAEEYNTEDQQRQNRLFKWNSSQKKWKEAAVLMQLPSKRYQTVRSDISDVTGKAITVTYTSMNYVTGKFYWDRVYELQSGKIVTKRSNKMKANYQITTHKNSWKTSRRFNAYTKVNCKKKAFRVKEGEKLEINRVYNNGKRMCLEVVRESGAKGWVNCPAKFHGYKYYFKNHAFLE